MAYQTEAEAIQTLRYYSNKRERYNEPILSALVFLADRGNTEKITLDFLCMWVQGGAYNARGGTATHFLDITYRYRETISNKFAYLAQTNLKVLEYLVDSIIEDYEEGPATEFRYGLWDTFFRIDPEKALPETRKYVNQMLSTDLGRHPDYSSRLKSFRQRLRGGKFLGLFG